MTTREQLTAERLDALLTMIENDGVTPPGEAPPAEHIRAIRGAGRRGEPDEVARAHRNGNGPPDFAGGSGNGNSGGA